MRRNEDQIAGEGDVVRIAVLRRIAGETLRGVDADARWQSNLWVGTAIAIEREA